jgi:hypothetical protein
LPPRTWPEKTLEFLLKSVNHAVAAATAARAASWLRLAAARITGSAHFSLIDMETEQNGAAFAGMSRDLAAATKISLPHQTPRNNSRRLAGTSANHRGVPPCI